MTVTVMSEGKASIETQSSATIQSDLEFVKCCCCGLTEECTQAYIARVRERYKGRWICGLCAEAVKDENLRSRSGITMDEALSRHIKFCEQFRSSSPPVSPTEDLISAMKQLLRRTLDSPTKQNSGFQTSLPFVRSKSCFSSFHSE